MSNVDEKIKRLTGGLDVQHKLNRMLGIEDEQQ
jgi:hypothetical protein